jgi:hypothetical protein
VNYVAAHEAFTPTLTGMGERHHLGPEVGLETHVQDIVAVLEFEELADVLLTAQVVNRVIEDLSRIPRYRMAGARS